MIGRNEELLLRLLRAALNEERLPLTDPPDWDAILQEAGAQTVLGLIAEALPDEVAAAARSEALRLKAKFMRILHGQTELVSLFRGAGIPLVILKGMAAAVYYPKPHTRAMGDVDFLVPRERFSDAMRLMEESGYLPLENHADTPAERPGDRQPPRRLRQADQGDLGEILLRAGLAGERVSGQLRPALYGDGSALTCHGFSVQ